MTRKKSEGVTHTSTVDTLMADINVRPALIGDMVNFRDEAGLKWRGVVLDIRRMVTLTNGLLVREDQLDALILDPFLLREARLAPVEKWAFVACIAQPQTVAVKLTHCWPHERGWWHRKTIAAKKAKQ